MGEFVEIRGKEDSALEALASKRVSARTDTFFNQLLSLNVDKVYSQYIGDGKPISRELNYIISDIIKNKKTSEVVNYELALHMLSRRLEQIRELYRLHPLEAVKTKNIINCKLHRFTSDDDEQEIIERDLTSVLCQVFEYNGKIYFGYIEATDKVNQIFQKISTQYLSSMEKVRLTISEMATIRIKKFEEDLKAEISRRLTPTQSMLLHHLIIEGVDRKATDVIFSSVEKTHIDVKNIIYGSQVHYTRITLTQDERNKFLSSISSLVGQTPTEFTLSGVQDLRIAEIGKTDRFLGRVNITTDDEKMTEIVIRIIDKKKKAIPLDVLNIQEEHKACYREFSKLNSGLVLVSGATSSGKTTTIYSILENIIKNRPLDRLVTVEDPVENILEGITQISRGDNLPFEQISQSLTRKNPKIIFLGEINSYEPARFAILSALQSLLVISTIHSDDAAGILPRVKLLMGQDSFLFESFIEKLKGITHQTMAKEYCPHCNQKMSKEDYLKYVINKDSTNTLTEYHYSKELDDIFVRRGITQFMTITEATKTCDACDRLGFIINSPVIISESLILDKSIRRDLININQGNFTGPQKTMTSFIEHCIDIQQTSKLDSAAKALADSKINIQEMIKILEIPERR